ncbi:MAG: glycosyltransferase family 39 protein [Proteobacteria bacterium]|nr:glycosyltransferase family 39 protein [Pseudomonadota bacterium]
MIAVGVVALQTACCLGLGASLLRLLKIDADITGAEHWAIAFAVGFGVLGWLVFPLGISGGLMPLPLVTLLVVGAMGVFFLRRPVTFFEIPRLTVAGWILLALLGVVGLFGLLEGIAPPTDADTLAYHFAVPQQFIAAGRIDFIFQALNGAVPFGVQMTYVPVMALGGDLAATLWTMISGWAAAALLFVLSRRHIGINWSLATALVYLTTPAIIYSGGSGHVEPRIALFVMVTAWATVRAIETGRVNYAVLAGFGAGFFVAAKYTGLLFAAVSGLVLIFQRRWFRHGAVFGLAVLAAGFQWYVWNAIHTGDPVFPMLFQWLGRDDLVMWTKAHDLIFKQNYFSGENPLPKTLPLLFLFPFRATLDFTGLPDAGRVGLGPYGLLVLPFAALGAWRCRDRIRQSPLLVFASLALLFYVAWFFGGGSQRLRHLVPILPLFLICVMVAAERATANATLRGPLVAAVMVTLLIQTAGLGLFSLNYFKFLAVDKNRQTFLTRNINGYIAVPWINANLAKTDLVLITQRQLRYYLSVPNFFGTSFLQAAVEMNPNKTNAQKFYRQIRSIGITHLLLTHDENAETGAYPQPMNSLHQAGCLTPLKRFQGQKLQSRSLPGLLSNPITLDVLKLEDEGCFK